MAESAGLAQSVDFSRKQSRPSGKNAKVKPSMKRSQSQFDNKELTKNGFASTLSLESRGKDSNLRETINESLPSVKGLANLGNTCFFNSVMQVLSQTHWLTQLLDMEVRDGRMLRLRGSEHDEPSPDCLSRLSEVENCDSKDDPSENAISVEGSISVEAIDVSLGPGKPLTLTLASFLKDMHCPAVTGASGKRRQSLSTVTPSSLFNQVCKKSPQFRGFQQQDAHELLRHLLDGIRTEEITRRRHAIMSHFNLPLTSVKNHTTEVDPSLKQKLKFYGKESAHTFVDQLFGGQLLSTVICDSCHQSYQILEPFMDLSLPVSEDKSPPSSYKKRTTVVDSLSCLGPSPPITLSKHQRKKERKAGRRGKGRRIISKQEEEVVSDSTNSDDVSPDLIEKNLKPPDYLSALKSEGIDEDEGEEKSPGSSGREDDGDDDEDIGGDIEDNNEDNNEDLNELISRIEEVRVDSNMEDENIDQHKMDSPPTTTTAKKIRSSWIAKSLCSLAVRYHATNQECSVQSCLNLFTAPELLTGSNKYGCENCTQRKQAAAIAEGATEDVEIPTVYSVASKQLLIFAPPAVLTLHLKRFTQNGIALRKAQKHVSFPLRFDLAPFCSAAAAGVSSIPAEQKEVIYSLFGVIEHSGRLSSGHYTAYVKVRPVTSHPLTKFLQREPMQTEDLYRLRDQLSKRLLAEDSTLEDSTEFSSEGTWYYCSDSQVLAVSEEKVLKSQAFLLFYERVL